MASSAFYGGTCENATRILGDAFVKEIPYVEITTSTEISRFYTTATYEWAGKLTIGYLIFVAVAVAVAVCVVFMIKTMK